MKENVSMSEMSLPMFTYHPDPVASGSVVPSDKSCVACQQVRGWIYVGPVYSEAEIDEALCPWCIADGTAHRLFGAEFVDREAVGDYGRLEAVSSAVLEEIVFRTPSFCGWQQERWLTHCGDASLFLGLAGSQELKGADPEVRHSIAEDSGFQGEDLSDYLDSLDRDYGPTAYLFRCRHCGTWSAYSDVA